MRNGTSRRPPDGQPRPSSRAEPARGHGHLEPAGPQFLCFHRIWCSNRTRARALGELRPPDPHVLVRLAVKRRPRGRGDSLGFRRLRRRNPHVPTPKWCRPRRRAEARAGTRAWGLPKGREPNPPKTRDLSRFSTSMERRSRKLESCGRRTPPDLEF